MLSPLQTDVVPAQLDPLFPRKTKQLPFGGDAAQCVLHLSHAETERPAVEKELSYKTVNRSDILEQSCKALKESINEDWNEKRVF